MNFRELEKAADTVDYLASRGGMLAEVTLRRHLGGYPHEQIAEELQITIEDSKKFAADGLRIAKDFFTQI